MYNKDHTLGQMATVPKKTDITSLGLRVSNFFGPKKLRVERWFPLAHMVVQWKNTDGKAPTFHE